MGDGKKKREKEEENKVDEKQQRWNLRNRIRLKSSKDENGKKEGTLDRVKEARE